MRNKYLRRARILERDFRAVLRCFAHDLPALTAAKMCGVNKNTTHRLYGLLRQRVVALAQAEAKPFVGGIVEIDESYFGPRRVRGQRGRGAGRKVPVIGLLKRAGKVFVQIVPNCSKAELLRVVHGQVKGATTIHTDGWKAYDGLVWDGFRAVSIKLWPERGVYAALAWPCKFKLKRAKARAPAAICPE